jgi:hypothetical protein
VECAAFYCIAFFALLKTYSGMNQAFKLPVYAVSTAALTSAVIRRDAKFPHEVGKRFTKHKPGFTGASRLGHNPI